MRERYLICKEESDKFWFLGLHSITHKPGWVREDINYADHDDIGIIAYNNYNAVKRLLLVVKEEIEPKAFIHILHF